MASSSIPPTTRRLAALTGHIAWGHPAREVHPEAVQAALSSLQRWGAAWDAGSVEGQIAEMHFPHVRLNASHGGPNHTDSSHDGFYTWAEANEFRQGWRPPPSEEGFARTEQENVTAVQAGPDKVQ
jgi:hypothetical protein